MGYCRRFILPYPFCQMSPTAETRWEMYTNLATPYIFLLLSLLSVLPASRYAQHANKHYNYCFSAALLTALFLRRAMVLLVSFIASHKFCRLSIYTQFSNYHGEIELLDWIFQQLTNFCSCSCWEILLPVALVTSSKQLQARFHQWKILKDPDHVR